MLSYFLVLVKTVAAAFWIIFSLFIKRAEQPPSKALQQFNHEVINAWISISAFDVESIGHNLDMFFKMEQRSLADSRDMAFK